MRIEADLDERVPLSGAVSRAGGGDASGTVGVSFDEMSPDVARVVKQFVRAGVRRRA